MQSNSIDSLRRAMQSKELGDFSKACEYLDRILEFDSENHMLWYEKSKLPIIQEDSIAIENRSISLSTYQTLSLADRSNYLHQCGFAVTELPDIESRLCIPNLLANQRRKYLKMAIKYAPERERVVYTAELEALDNAEIKQTRKDTRASILAGLIALPVAILTALLINFFYGTSLFQTPMNVVIILLIPYALSIAGMVAYTKAKNNGNGTALGLVLNLLALIISNLSIINAIILFLNK